MDSLRYTASGRLGLWNSIQFGREDFFEKLTNLLQVYSHGVIESDRLEFITTDNTKLASITAICDKIISRGNPTLIDLDFEQYLLKGHCRQFFHLETDPQSPNCGFRLVEVQFPGTMNDLLEAAEELLELPFRDTPEESFKTKTLPPNIRELISQEEGLFLDQFRATFGGWLGSKIHQQVLIRDLVNGPNDDLTQSRVDFAYQAGGKRWVFEIDGSQHNDPSQQDLDNRRDNLLKENGWEVFRLTTGQVRQGLHSWLQSLRNYLPSFLLSPNFLSIQSAVSHSELHKAAYFTILLPLATHRCLKGLLQLYSTEILDPGVYQRILILEEDLPVTVEAFRQLVEIWGHIHNISPETPPPPELELEIIGGKPICSKSSSLGLRSVKTPKNNYDIIISSAYLLRSDSLGHLEQQHFKKTQGNKIRLRHAIGFRSERSLQWCRPIAYALAEVENEILSETTDTTIEISANKLNALHFFLQLVFRKRDFWDGQLRVVCRLLQGKATIVLLPTGGGKSLTYQLSGLLMPGMTIVIDPLVALMSDQAENLNTSGIDLVGFISSQLDPTEKESSLHDLETGRLAFIYVSPERLQIQDFRNQLQTVVSKFPVSLAVIDEAHCVSEWGHDFRPAYLHMPSNLQRYCSGVDGGKPILVGLTGTASFAVLTDIQMEMEVTDEDAIVLPKSFDRKELRFEVRTTPMASKKAALRALKQQMPILLRTNPQYFYDLRGDQTNSGIIFCPHVNGQLGVAMVASHMGHKNYFAGQRPNIFQGDAQDWNFYKYRVQQAFKRNAAQELVATKSFGMGIDKPNIRYTIHYVIPQSVEAFYQEAGRAGRNGIENYGLCSILYSDDNWDTALEVLNEPDHRKALAKLNSISWDDRGDLLVQLWLMFNSYRGRSEEKSLTLNFWKDRLASVILGLPTGSTNTQEISFGNGNQDRANTEKAIFRLMLLGVVEDYTINWQTRHFFVRVKHISSFEVKDHLRRYLMQYKFQDFANKTVRDIPEDTVINTLQTAIDVLIDFIYDEIVAKRKQALRTMGELCRNFNCDQEFRDAILAYLQESEFSEELREWINQSFEEIGKEAVNDVLDRVTTLEEIKRLVGTTRRMLDEDPLNIALRYLSICARAQSAAESDASVLNESTTLAHLVKQQQENLTSGTEIMFSILEDINIRRPTITSSVGNILLRKAGTPALARLILESNLAKDNNLCALSKKLLTARAFKFARECGFYSNLSKELQNG